MSVQFLSHTDHRPWPLPEGGWIMAQSWHDLLFAHWPIPIETMRQLIPPELELDTFEELAWVGVVPFRMSGIRPRGFPAVPWLSAFLEFNVRTYVKSKSQPSKPGVYFFSLDAANPLAVAVARATYKLPYFNAKMSLLKNDDESFTYMTNRTHRGAPSAEFAGSYGPRGDVFLAREGTIDHWLTERYCLYTVSKGKVYRGEIHHLPWPLQPAFLKTDSNTMASAGGIELPNCDPILHFSKSIDVVVWPIEKV